MPSFTRESGGTLHVAVMGVNRIGKDGSNRGISFTVATRRLIFIYRHSREYGKKSSSRTGSWSVGRLNTRRCATNLRGYGVTWMRPMWWVRVGSGTPVRRLFQTAEGKKKRYRTWRDKDTGASYRWRMLPAFVATRDISLPMHSFLAIYLFGWIWKRPSFPRSAPRVVSQSWCVLVPVFRPRPGSWSTSCLRESATTGWWYVRRLSSARAR